MKANFVSASSMVMELKGLLMEICTRASTQTGSPMDSDSIFGQMEATLRGSSRTD